MYTVILRKLKINNKEYYQVIDKIFIENENINIDNIDTINYLGKNIKPLDLNSNDLLSYIEVNENEYEEFDELYNIIIRKTNNGLDKIDNIFEYNEIIKSFYNKFRDFNILPNINLPELCNEVEEKLNNRLIGQEDVISQIVSKIKNNQMYINTDLPKDMIERNISNMLIVSPAGHGKTTLKKILLNSMGDIPIVEHSLSDDYKNDIKEIMQKLLIKANNNLELASRGIVIYDGINDNLFRVDEEFTNYDPRLNTLGMICHSNDISLMSEDNTITDMSLSMLTHIALVDADSEVIENVDVDELLCYKQVLNCDEPDVVIMNNMTKELAKKILMHKQLSPLNDIKKAFASISKEVKFSRDFIDQLIEKGLILNNGMEGILSILREVQQLKNNTPGNIVKFTKKDIDNIELGIHKIDSELSYVKETVIKKDKFNKSGLDVNLDKRTINGYTVDEVCELAMLDIKGQDEQIYEIVNAIFKNIFNRFYDFNQDEIMNLKNNILVIGNTGVGKTLIIKTVAKILGLPFRKEDITRYTRSGYVGEDVDSMLKNLVDEAKGDIKLAEFGILFIDEIDKLAVSNGSNIDMGRDVQNSLLTLIEGELRKISPGHNQNFNSFDIDTRGLTIAAAGAFSGIDKIISSRIESQKRGNKIGFTTTENKVNIDKNLTLDDFVKFGMDTQLMERFSLKSRLNDLNIETLLNIINDSKSGYINLARKTYELEGKKIILTDEFKQELAKRAYLRKSGARAIKSLFSSVLKYIDKNKRDAEEIILNEKCFDNPDEIIYIKKK